MIETTFIRRVRVKPVIKVWMEEPSELMRRYMGLSAGSKMLVVREPCSEAGGYRHCFRPDTGNETGTSNFRATILAISEAKHISPREVLEKLQESKDNVYELTFSSRLSYIGPDPGYFTKMEDLSPEESRKLMVKIAQVHAETKKQKAQNQAEKFTRSKRFAKKLNKINNGTMGVRCSA